MMRRGWSGAGILHGAGVSWPPKLLTQQPPSYEWPCPGDLHMDTSCYVNGEAVMRLLRAATHRGIAGAVVRHEAQLAPWADRVVFLPDGHVVDQTVAPAGPELLVAADARR